MQMYTLITEGGIIVKRLVIGLVCLALLLSGVGAFAEPLKKGDKGDEVTALQLELIEHNYLADGADGIFGGVTERAIQQVQADAGLEQTGIADDATLEFLSSNYAEFEAKKDSDILMYKVECDPALMNMLTLHVKNTGRQRITGIKFKLYQCNASKTSLGTFFGKRNSSTKRKRTEYWTEHSAEVDIGTGENGTASMILMEGWTANFSDGTSQSITWFDNGVYARVVLYEYTTEDGKTHKADQKLYCEFR